GDVFGTADESLRVAGDYRRDMSAATFGRDHLYVEARLLEEALLDGEIERHTVHGVDGFRDDEWLERLCQNSRARPHHQSDRDGDSTGDGYSLHGLSPLIWSGFGVRPSPTVLRRMTPRDSTSFGAGRSTIASGTCCDGTTIPVAGLPIPMP